MTDIILRANPDLNREQSRSMFSTSSNNNSNTSQLTILLSKPFIKWISNLLRTSNKIINKQAIKVKKVCSPSNSTIVAKNNKKGKVARLPRKPRAPKTRPRYWFGVFFWIKV